MIRPFTLLTIVAAAGAGLHVYNTKHAVSLLDRELRTIARDIGEAEARTQALQAEWVWATEQERLRALVQRHLALEPMQPSQFVRLAEAERRIPAPAAEDDSPPLFAPGEAAAATADSGARTRIALLPPEAPANAATAPSPAVAPARRRRRSPRPCPRPCSPRWPRPPWPWRRTPCRFPRRRRPS